MNKDIRISVNFFGHPKTVKLERRLGAKAVNSLIQLWTWAAKNCPDGDFEGVDNESLAIAADWKENEDEFINALVDIGWLDGEQNNYSLHDWAEHNHWVVEAKHRSDVGRFSRLGQLHPKAYARLAEQGVNAISKKEYLEIIASLKVDTPEVIIGVPNGKVGLPPADPMGETKGTLGVSPALTLTLTPALTPALAQEEEEDLITSYEVIRQQGKPVDNCPHETVIEIYHKLLPERPKVRVWKEAQKTQLKARWREDKARQNIEWWHEYFAEVQKSDFLMGKNGKWNGCNLLWLVKANNMAKVLNGYYTNTERKNISAAAKSTSEAVNAWLEENENAKKR